MKFSLKIKNKKRSKSIKKKNFRSKLLKLLVVGFLILQTFSIPVQRVFAVPPVTWVGVGGGFGGDNSTWQDPHNWSGNATPTASDDVTIDGGGTITVAGDGTLNFSTLTIGGASAGILNLTGDIGTGGSITIGNGGTLSQQNLNPQTIIGTLTVQSGGTLTHKANVSTLAYEVNFTAANVDVQAGGTINADGKGYAGGATNTSGNGPGPGLFGNYYYGGGGANGGNGGVGNGIAGGTRYCNLVSPNDLGSGGGGSNGGAGGAGGGLIILNISGTLTLDAPISANGGTGASYNMGGGAGGSMNITAGAITTTLGTAPISTFNGGSGTEALGNGGGGGGGCVRVFGSTGSGLFSATSFTVAGATQPPGYSVGSVGQRTFHNGSNVLPTVTSISPAQTAGNIVTFTTTIADADTDQTSLHVEYSLDNSTWTDATLATVTETSGEGTVTTSPGQVLGIDTGIDGSVNLSVQWDSSIDIPTTNGTVYLRVTPSDGIGTGVTQTSTGFLDDVAVAWTGGASTLNWDDAGNWSNGLVPISTENVTIEPSTDVTVTTSGTPIQFNTLTVGGKAGSANLILVGNIGTGTNIILKGDGLGHTGTLTQKNLTTQTISGDITIKNGGVLTHAANAGTHAYSINFSANNIDLQAGGSINANVVGYVGGSADGVPGTGPGGGGASSPYGAGGANGGNGGPSDGGGLGGTAYCNITAPNDLGSGGAGGNGGAGGRGGGLITLNVTSNFVIDDVISANGGTGLSYNMGGGGGGSLNIRAQNITTTLGSAPIATFNGGDGMNNSGGDGGGGCVLVTYGTLNGLFTTASFHVLNGPGTTGHSGTDGQVSLVLGSFNTAPTATALTFGATPSQTSTTEVGVATTIADADSDPTSLTVQYCTEALPTDCDLHATWANPTISSVDEGGVGNGTTVTGNVISGIDTNISSVNLTFNWDVATDVPNTESSTVYLKVTPNDGTVDGTTQTSTVFAVDTKPPTVTDAYISISGGSGTGGAYKIGSTVTATWDDSAGGQNNSDTISTVTVNFTQFGGGAAVSATTSDAGATWTASFSVIAGIIDLTNRNVSVTATDDMGNVTTAADTTNATVDNIAPVLTAAKISVTGATGTSLAFKNGDVAVPTWNNTLSGDNNTDTISSVSFNAVNFRAGDTALVGSNSSGTWTASLSGAMSPQDDLTNNVTVTVTDNAGNTTTVTGTNDYTIDTIVPIITSVSPTASTSINSVTTLSDVSYTLSEAVASGTILISQTSGTTDGSAPHTCTLKGTAKNTGAHANLDLSDTTNSCVADTSGLVSGAVYTFAFNVTDDAGNTAAPVSAASVTFDNTAPTAAITYSKDAGVTYASTESVRNADTLRIKATFNEPMADSPVVKIAIDNSVLSAIAMTKVSTTEYTYDLNVPAGDVVTATVSMSIGTDVGGTVITAVPTSGSTFTIDNTAPTLAEVTAAPSSTDTTPDYTFSSDEAGTIIYGGSCSSTTTAALASNNTVTFAALAVGSYTNCTVTVTDAVGNASTALSVSVFTISVPPATGGGGYISTYPPLTQQTQEPTPAQQPQTQLATQALFSDIQDHWAKIYIEKLQQKCDVQGYKDADGNLLNEYRPNNTISRAELVKVVMQCQFPALEAGTEDPFLDVHTTDWFGAAVSKAKLLGVVVGSKNYFLPFKLITRAEALKVVLATIYADQDIHGNALTFTDVSATAWYVKYIAFAVDHGFISGYVDGQGNPLNLVGPNNNLTRGEAAKIIVKVFFRN